MPAVTPPASTPPVPNEADFIGPYRLGHRLGSGGMGEVYEGYDKRLDRSVALKRVRPGAKDAERARLRFRREARSVARLHHPSIVQIHDLVETEGGDWIVMELVEGRSLRNVLREGPLEPTRAARLIMGILEGLAVAHGAGVVHRDLKAENVMIAVTSSPGSGGNGEQAKILDFGLAKRYDPESGESEISVDGGLIGSPPAMSPEMLLGRPVDQRSDLFSLGSLSYEMLTGVSPFLGNSPGETLNRVCTFKPEAAARINPEVPEPLAAFVERLLEKDPRRRPQSAEQALAALETARKLMKDDSAAQPTVVSAEDLATLFPEDLTPSQPRSAIDKRLAWVVFLLAAFVLAGLGWRSLQAPSESIYVAVPATEIAAVEGEDSSRRDLDLAASAVRTALLRALLGFRDLAALEPMASEASIEDPVLLARAMAADEVLTSRLECGARNCQLVLKRLQGSDGRPLWTHGFTVSPDQLLDLSLAVIEHLGGAYPQAVLREGVPALEVKPEDYEMYLVLKERIGRRDEGLSKEDLLADLGKLERSSPRFVPLPLFEAQVQSIRYQVEKVPAVLEAAENAVARARAVAPEDPRVLTRQAQVARVGGRYEEAAAALEALRRLEPGNAQQMVLHAQLLERQGKVEEALEQMREALKQLPSAVSHFTLADMLYRKGDVDEARSQLETGLELSPENFDGRSRLAQLELMSGSPERAVVLYEGLVERSAEVAELTNLGTAYLLVSRYEEAAERFREAFELAPGFPQAALSLADAELLLNKIERAEELYGTVLELIDQGGDPEALLTIRAQALIRLGRIQEAVAAVQEALRRHPDHPGVSYEAALVYCLVGDEASAVWNARRALDKGFEPRWFTFPWFDPIRDQLEPLAEVPAGNSPIL